MKVLKFGAVWCPICLIMKPRWAEIEKENPWLESQYFDYDEDQEEVKKYDIGKSLPVFIFFANDGTEILRLKGEVSKKDIIKILEDNKNK